MPTIEQWLADNTSRLLATSISSARLDCLILLEDCLQKDRAFLLAHPEQALTSQQLKLLEEQIERRASHEPLAYIRGKAEFFGRTFAIDHSVLQPRPESETMIELLLHIVKSRKQKAKEDLVIVDVGTGSGALAITAKLELPQAKVHATDIDPKCLKIARANARALKANINFYEGDLLETLPVSTFQQPTVILANLPYVPDSYKINRAAQSEPKHAIFGGKDGLDLYRRLFEQLSQAPSKPVFVLTESLPPQHKELENIVGLNGYRLLTSKDFIQQFAIAE